MNVPLLSYSDAGTGAVDKINVGLAALNDALVNIGTVQAGLASVASSNASHTLQIDTLAGQDTNFDSNISTLQNQSGAALSAISTLQGQMVVVRTYSLLSDEMTKRPGDAPGQFGASIQGGDPSAIVSAPPGVSVPSDGGQAQRIAGQVLLAPIRLFPVEIGRRYLVRVVVQRRVDPVDPAGDAVIVGLAWYDGSKTPLSAATSNVATITNLSVATGPVVVTAVMSLAPGTDVTVIPPANARYCRPFVQCFGTQQQTDVQVLAVEDITSAVLTDSVSADALAWIAAQEALDLPVRVSALESEVAAPAALVLSSIAALKAAHISGTVRFVRLIGGASAGDGGEALWARTTTTATPVAATVMSADGAYWTPTGLSRAPAIEVFGGGAAVADNGPAILAAVAAGVTRLYIKGACAIASALDQATIADMSFVGTGSLTGTVPYAKRVMPPDVHISPSWSTSDLVPDIHLSKLAGVTNPVVVLVGDSLTTYFANSAGRMNMLANRIEQHLKRHIPGVVFYDRGIGGMTWSAFGEAIDLSAFNLGVPWVTPGLTWPAAVQALNPDLVIFAFGMNTQNQLWWIDASYLAVISYIKVPDVVFCTNVVPSLAWAGYADAANQDLRLKDQGLDRSYAMYRGCGLLDFGRQMKIVRDGEDVRQSLLYTGDSPAPTGGGSATLTFNGTKQVRDFRADITFDATYFGSTSNDSIWITVGSDAATEFVIFTKDTASGCYQVQAYAAFTGPSVVPIASAVTSKTVPASGSDQLVIEKVDNELLVYTTVDGSFGAYTPNLARLPLITRADLYTPQVYSPGGRLLTTVGFYYGEPRKSVPQATDSELFGLPGVPDGGIYPKGNHYTGYMDSLVLGPVLDAQIWNTKPADQSWVDFTPVVTAAGGSGVTFGALTSAYKLTGKILKFRASFTVAYATLPANLSLYLPNGRAAKGAQVLDGVNAGTITSITAFVDTGSTTVLVLPALTASGQRIVVSGEIEVL